jgi:hypothetical protein
VIAAIRKAESTVGGAMETADAAEPPASAEPGLRTTVAELEDAPIAVDFEDETVVELDVQPEARSPAPASESSAPADAQSETRSEAVTPTTHATESTSAAAVEADERDDAAAEIRPLESTASSATAAAAEASFLRQVEAPKPRRRRLLIAAAVLLALLALAQLAVVFRSDIAASVPQTRPVLGQLCRLFGCTVNWPSRPELLAVIGTELRALPGSDLFELTAIVRNRGPFTIELPAIELTLTDTLDRTVARKIFTPADYLAGSGDARTQIDAGLAAGADLTVRVAFEARGVNAAGFVVYPLYL